FFFQAEDGIRDFHVTGVQTCALPISQAEAADGHTGLVVNAIHLLNAPAVEQAVVDHRLGTRSAFLSRLENQHDGAVEIARLTEEIGRASCRESVSMRGAAGSVTGRVT